MLPAGVAGLWHAKALGHFREEGLLPRIERHHAMRQAVIAAIGGWRADRALAGTFLEVRGALDRIKTAAWPRGDLFV